MRFRRELTALAVLALIAVCSWLLFGAISSAGGSEETELVRSAVRNAAITCYAVEGAYPGDVAYLREHYGLRYDEKHYIVSYHAFADNLIPEIRVLERGSGE